MKTDEKFVADILVAIDENKVDVGDNEREFVESMNHRINASGLDMTRKQREWIADIHAKIRLW